MKTEFLAILRSPESGQPLVYDASDKQLQAADGARYKLLEGVPVLLQQAEEAPEYQAHYQQDAEAFDYFSDWDPITQEENRRLHQQIVQQIPASAEWILDVGCGGAWLARTLTPKGRKVISMDISTTNPLRANKEITANSHYALVADVYALPFASHSIDCIVAAEIIEHVPNPASFLQSLLQVLKPGGTLIVSTPYNEKIQYSLCIHCNERTPHNAHLHSFTESSIKKLLPIQQLQAETIVCNSKLLVTLRLQKLFKNLPFGIWNALDKLAIKLVKKAHRLILVVNK